MAATWPSSGTLNWDTPLRAYITAAVSGISVKNYGALGDGSTDDTTAVNDAIAAADALGDANSDYTPDVYFPPGIYMANEIDLTDKKVLLKGDGPNVCRLQYNGAGGAGTALVKSGTNVGGSQSSGGFEGMYLYGKAPSTAQCVNLYKKTGNTGHDIFFRLRDFAIGGCSGDGMDFGPARVVNMHVDHFRVDGLGGWGFRVAGDSGGEHEPITFSNFTVDCGTFGGMKGMLRVDDGQGYYLHVKDGRMEGNSNLTAETVGSTTERSWILNVNTLSSYGAYIWLENVMGFTQAANTHAVVRDASGSGNAIRGRADVVNFDNTYLFRSDTHSASNVAAISPQDMQTHFFTAG